MEDRVIQAEKLHATLTAASAEAEVRRLDAERVLQEIAAARLREEQEVVSACVTNGERCKPKPCA